ncbi:venom metalloproteinase inhibitor DM43-like [Heterodontus francisci]|uniref:venom metalloproteinase inhibitor DM43-like n=1 Tax=Heterodontus francisci TaxID=7792 RepID=UPI00355C467B
MISDHNMLVPFASGHSAVSIISKLFMCLTATDLALKFPPLAMFSGILLLVTGASPRPTLSLDSLSDVILKGESVKITCRSPHPSRKHYFFKDGMFLQYNNVPATLYTTDYLISYIKHRDAGKYVCKYVTQIGVKWVQSSPSNPVNLNVRDQLPKPTISLNIAAGVFTLDETAWIKCTGRLRSTGSKFHLYKEGASYPTEIVISEGAQQTVTFAIRNIKENNEGKYKCLYQRTVSGRTAVSPFSDLIQITVIDNLPKPLIYLTSESDIVLRGTKIQFLCKGPEEYPSNIFHLYQNNSTTPVQLQTAAEGNHSVLFSIDVAEQSEETTYKCGYKASVFGRLMHSTSSRSVKVMIRNLAKFEATPLDVYFENSSWDNTTCGFASPCHYTVANYKEAIIRLCISGFLLLVMVIFIIEYLMNIGGKGILDDSADAHIHAKLNKSKTSCRSTNV